MFEISIHAKGARVQTIQKLVETALRAKFPDAGITVSKKTLPTSRSDRLSAAQSDVEGAKSTAEELISELESWRDGLPENLQGGEKAQQLEDALSSLQEFIDACETAEQVSVDFPQMY